MDPAQMYRDCCVVMLCNYLRKQLVSTGVPALVSVASLLSVVYLLAVLVGFPLIVFRLDKGKTSDDVQGGYSALAFFGGWGIVPFGFMIASLPGVGPLIRAVVLAVFQGMVLTLILPVTTKLYGTHFLVFLIEAATRGEQGPPQRVILNHR